MQYPFTASDLKCTLKGFSAHNRGWEADVVSISTRGKESPHSATPPGLKEWERFIFRRSKQDLRSCFTTGYRQRTLSGYTSDRTTMGARNFAKFSATNLQLTPKGLSVSNPRWSSAASDGSTEGSDPPLIPLPRRGCLWNRLINPNKCINTNGVGAGFMHSCPLK